MDLKSNIKVLNAVSPYDPSATGAKTGIVIDRKGFGGVTFIISAGAQTTAGITVTPVVKEGAATNALASAADADLVGTEAAAAAVLAGSGGADKSATIGYLGSKRYVSCGFTLAGAATGFYSAVAVLHDPIKAPPS
jgi:hypothetical protein